jgi:hypothetical protein
MLHSVSDTWWSKYEVTVKWYWQAKVKVSGAGQEGSVPAPFCPKQTSHKLVWNRTRFSAVKGPTFNFLTMALAWHQCHQGSLHREKLRKTRYVGESEPSVFRTQMQASSPLAVINLLGMRGEISDHCNNVTKTSCLFHPDRQPKLYAFRLLL